MILTIAKAIGRRVHAVLEVLFPGPTDDLMAVAEAVGITPTPEEMDAQERRAYHLAMCEVTELMAKNRTAQVGMQDLTFWRLEMSMRGEQS